MLRKVEGLENFKQILELPIGSRFGLFVEKRIDEFLVTSYLDRVAKTSDDPSRVSTVMIPTYPMVRRDHTDPRRDLVFEDPATGLMRVLYESDLKGPLQGIPWELNRAVALPSYLYSAGAAPCFNACFVFVDAPVGSEICAVREWTQTETFFISMKELNKPKL